MQLLKVFFKLQLWGHRLKVFLSCSCGDTGMDLSWYCGIWLPSVWWAVQQVRSQCQPHGCGPFCLLAGLSPPPGDGAKCWTATQTPTDSLRGECSAGWPPPAVPWHSLEVKPVLAISPNKNPDPFPPISSLLMPLPVFPSSYLHGKKKIIPTSACCQRAPGRIYPFQPIEVPRPWSQVPPNVPVPPDLQSLAHNRGDKSLLSVPPPHAKPQHVPRAVASRAALLCQGAGFILRLI